MSNEKMREEFEAWIVRDVAKSCIPAHLRRKDDPDMQDRYKMVWVDAAWLGWQASRASLEVELPADKHAHSTGYNKALNDVRAALQSAGVRVKP